MNDLSNQILKYLQETEEEYPDVISISAHLKMPMNLVGDALQELIKNKFVIVNSGKRFLAGSYYSAAG